MASRIWCVVLMAGAILVPAMPVHAETTSVADEGTLLDPRIERRRVHEAMIDSENIEVGAFAGVISLEDFGVNTLAGIRAAFHVSEDVFFEATLASSEAGDTSFERLNPGVRLLDDEQREWLAWHLDVGCQLLPGEAFLGRHRAFNTGLYVLAGAGNVEFGGDDQFSVNMGIGYRVLLTDWLGFRVEMRDYLYEIDTFGEKQVSQNLAWTFGLGGFF